MPHHDDTTSPAARAQDAAAALRERFGIDRVDVGLVLGSGWKSGLDEIGTPLAGCELDELPGREPHGRGGRASFRQLRARAA